VGRYVVYILSQLSAEGVQGIKIGYLRLYFPGGEGLDVDRLDLYAM
jgi:hypothetical protein